MTASFSDAGSEVDWCGNVGILMSKFRSIKSPRCDMHPQAALRAMSRSSNAAAARPLPVIISGRFATHVQSPLPRVRVDGVKPHRKSQPWAEFPWKLSQRLPIGALSSAVSSPGAASEPTLSALARGNPPKRVRIRVQFVLMTSSKTVGARSMRPASAHHDSSPSSATSAVDDRFDARRLAAAR
jgi:hypothetical protein